MKNLLKLTLVIASFAFIFIGYAGVLYIFSEFLSHQMGTSTSTLFYILLIPNFFFTMFTVMDIDKRYPQNKVGLLFFFILLLLSSIRFFIFSYPKL